MKKRVEVRSAFSLRSIYFLYFPLVFRLVGGFCLDVKGAVISTMQKTLTGSRNFIVKDESAAKRK